MQSVPNQIKMLPTPAGVSLAYQAHAGRMPTVVWMSGFRSDMSGTKAQALADWAERRGQSFLRFDYSGHGRSEGRFEDGTIGQWKADALAALDQLTSGPLILVGSSMGGWLALLAGLARRDRTVGLVLVAPAADFTERLLRPNLSAQALQDLKETGRHELASQYDPEPTILTQRLFKEGRTHLVLNAPIPLTIPVRILQGQEDQDVPWRHALETAQRIESQNIQLTLIKDGDHRLSRPSDIALLIAITAQLADDLSA